MNEITLALQPYAETQLKAFTSRPLADGEELCLLTCGKGRSRCMKTPGWEPHLKSTNRWHVKWNGHKYDNNTCFNIGGDDIIRFLHNQKEVTSYFPWIIGGDYASHADTRGGTVVPANVYVKKANHDNYWFPNDTKVRKLCFAFAIYRGRERISNVAYFRINFRLKKPLTLANDDTDLLCWLTLK